MNNQYILITMTKILNSDNAKWCDARNSHSYLVDNETSISSLEFIMVIFSGITSTQYDIALHSFLLSRKVRVSHLEISIWTFILDLQVLKLKNVDEWTDDLWYSERAKYECYK